MIIIGLNASLVAAPSPHPLSGQPSTGIKPGGVTGPGPSSMALILILNILTCVALFTESAPRLKKGKQL